MNGNVFTFQAIRYFVMMTSSEYHTTLKHYHMQTASVVWERLGTLWFIVHILDIVFVYTVPTLNSIQAVTDCSQLHKRTMYALMANITT